MHISQGLFSHATDVARAELRSIDEKGEWLRKAKLLLQEVETFLASDEEYKKLQKRDRELQDDISLLQESVEEKRCSQNVSSALVSQAERHLDLAKLDRKKHSQETGYATQTLLRKGAMLFQPKLKDYIAKSHKKPLGPSEFCFNKGIENSRRSI